MAPRDEAMLVHMLRTAIAHDGPIAMRYPRGAAVGVPLPDRAGEIRIGTGETLAEGERVALVGYGTGVQIALDAAAALRERGHRRRPSATRASRSRSTASCCTPWRRRTSCW